MPGLFSFGVTAKARQYADDIRAHIYGPAVQTISVVEKMLQTLEMLQT